MGSYHLSYVQTHLTELVKQAAQGHSFIITDEHKSLVQVSAAPQQSSIRRVGFLQQQPHKIPDDFNRMNQKEIEQLFGIE